MPTQPSSPPSPGWAAAPGKAPAPYPNPEETGREGSARSREQRGIRAHRGGTGSVEGSPGLWGFIPPPMPEKEMGQERVFRDPISGVPLEYWSQFPPNTL